MKKIILKLVIGAIAIVPFTDTYGQETPKSFGKKVIPCGSSEYETLLQKKYPGRATTAQFEEWLAPKVEAIKKRRLQRSGADSNDEITIPVVVHVIHNGDAVGANENISDEQIMSQITVLNQDYRRMPDTAGFNDNPVGADTGVGFCLAQRDPNGLATTGITRHNYSNTTWDVNDIDEIIKPQTQWDPNLYLNLWVVNDITIDFFGMSMPGIKGYAQFPSASGLQGLDGEQDIANLAGVVIGHKYFGSPQIYPGGTYDSDDVRGRTASHEIGHYFGLRHIWGDGDCTVDDFCADTPEAAEATQGTCPSGVDSCPDSPGVDMVENYMDYSSEGCMNIFTQDQKDRILAVLQNSPRRSPLSASIACSAAVEYQNDGSLNIQQIDIEGCSNRFSPVLKIFNSGTSVLTSASIEYHIDNGTVSTYNWTGSLAHGEEQNITLPVLGALSGQHQFNATIVSVNGGNDESSFNNVKSYDFKIAMNLDITEVAIEVQQDAFGSETTWKLTNSAGDIVASGGPYENIMDQNAELPVHTSTVALEGNQCYTFTIDDDGGNGIVGMFGEGHYLITSGSTNLIGQGGVFGDSDAVSFAVNLILGTKESAALHGITIYPVPSSESINITIPENLTADTYTIFNALGQIIKNDKITTAQVNVNISGYTKGVYYIKISSNNEHRILSFIKN
jgi:hypothetical protein